MREQGWRGIGITRSDWGLAKCAASQYFHSGLQKTGLDTDLLSKSSRLFSIGSRVVSLVVRFLSHTGAEFALGRSGSRIVVYRLADLKRGESTEVGRSSIVRDNDSSRFRLDLARSGSRRLSQCDCTTWVSSWSLRMTSVGQESDLSDSSFFSLTINVVYFIFCDGVSANERNTGVIDRFTTNTLPRFPEPFACMYIRVTDS